ncbi:MAG: hypothetical protein LUC17_05030 [Oscillospiraceae bacterium]|nr:hypothetical protein [Oscillospiraceae bacterium]
MKLELTEKQYRRLLDMAYIGNWILNSTRGEDRFQDYDDVESLLFGKAAEAGMDDLSEMQGKTAVPSQAFVEGGIHEAIVDYENCIFFDVLAEDLARRDMEEEQIDADDQQELLRRIDAYLEEFELHGTDHVLVISED